MEPYLVVLNSLPKSALAPLLIVWLGATRTTIIVAGMSVAIFGSILNLYTSFQTVDTEKIKLIYTLHGNRLHAFKSRDPPFHSGDHQQYESKHRALSCRRYHRRISGSAEWTWISDHLLSEVFKLDWLLMSIVLLCILAMFLYACINLIEKLYLGKHRS